MKSVRMLVVFSFIALTVAVALPALAQWTTTPGSQQINGDLDVKGDAAVGDDLSVTGDLSAGSIAGPTAATTLSASGASTLNGNTTIGNATTDVAKAYIIEVGAAGATNGIAAYQLYTSNGIVRIWGN